MRELVAIVVSLVLLGPSLLRAESLGDVAAREKKKKEGKPAGKVITEADLGKGGRGTYNNPDDISSLPTDVPVAAPAGGDNKPENKEKTADEVRADAEAKYREDLKAKNDEVTRIKSRITLLENSGAYASSAVATEIEQLSKDLKAAEQAVADLEVLRQRAGYRR